MHHLWGLIILIQAHCLIGAAAGGADSWSVLGGTRLKEVTVPVYLNRNPTAAGAIRVQDVFGGHQKRGLFRIGLFPAVIAETVKFEITNEKEATEVMIGMDSYLRQVSNGRLWELRAISLHVAGSVQPRLEARRMVVEANGIWRLDRCTVFDGDGKPAYSSQAFLDVRGRDGLLRWHQGGAVKMLMAV